MAVEAEAAVAAGTTRRAGWRAAPRVCGGLRRKLRQAAPAALAFVTAAVLMVLCIAQVAAGSPARAAMVAAIGLGACGAAFAAGRSGAALASHFVMLKQALDTAPDAQLIMTTDGQVIHTNSSFGRLFLDGLTRPLDRIDQFVAADPGAAAEFRRLRDRMAAGEAAVAEIALADTRGESIGRFKVSAAPIGKRLKYSLWNFQETGPRPEMAARIEDEDRQRIVGSVDGQRSRAIAGERTPEHRPDVEPAQSREHFRRFFANAPVGIAVIDGMGCLVEANGALGKLFGAVPKDLTGRKLIGLLNEGDRAAIAAKLAAAADGQIDREPVEVRLEGPHERTMVLLLSRLDENAVSGPLPASTARSVAAEGIGADGDPRIDLTLYFIDVTEQKNLETQFAQSQKMQAVGQLAGGVAHDFNNLLTAMIGFCDLLLLRSRPGDPAFADIMQIKQNANRAANLVRQLLAFSRQQTLQPRVLDITDVLVELSHLLRRLIGENIELEVVHARQLGLVKVDQGQLEQVVINLAVNARDAMPNGGRLTIRTENVHQAAALRHGPEVMPAGDYVLIEVADTGVGISPDNLAHIFEPFFSTKEVGSGTGLGLSTVYGIVKQTGGFVFVESGPGRGAAFEIYLPRHQAATPEWAARAEAAEPVEFKDLTGTGAVMLVEDDDAVRMFGARALRNKGYRVTEAKSGEAALELITNATENIDLLITDVVMPRMDGPALVREVRMLDPAIRVIFISGYTEDAFRQRLDSDSEIHFLAKPFTLKQLAIKVKDVLASDDD
jgi:two-component system cell cycle sensor histidine kinase/response regulator CckA